MGPRIRGRSSNKHANPKQSTPLSLQDAHQYSNNAPRDDVESEFVNEYESSVFRGAELIRQQILAARYQQKQRNQHQSTSQSATLTSSSGTPLPPKVSLQRDRFHRRKHGSSEEMLDYIQDQQYEVKKLDALALNFSDMTPCSISERSSSLQSAPNMISPISASSCSLEDVCTPVHQSQQQNKQKTMTQRNHILRAVSVEEEEDFNDDANQWQPEVETPQNIEGQASTSKEPFFKPLRRLCSFPKQSTSHTDGNFPEATFQSKRKTKSTTPEQKQQQKYQLQQQNKQTLAQRSSSDSTLSQDPAYLHAQNAGLLWQTIVGEYVRFPKTWWNGKRTPQMSGSIDTPSTWKYISRNRVRGNPLLNKLVKSSSKRREGGGKGRLLLHLVIQDSRTWAAVEDVMVGCYHPKHVQRAQRLKSNGKSNTLNTNDANVVYEDDVREIYMALRKRRNDSGSMVDSLLTQNRDMDEVARQSPIGDKHSVDNYNVRALFGDEPPLETVFVMECSLYESMCSAREHSTARTCSPAILLLQEFLFK